MESSPSGGWGEQFYRVLEDLKFSPTPVGGFTSPPQKTPPTKFLFPPPKVHSPLTK